MANCQEPRSISKRMNCTVSTHTTPINAHIMRCRLQHEGIPAFVLHEQHVWADWSVSVALGGVRVQVPACDRDEATRVVASVIDGAFETELIDHAGGRETSPCPRCKSTHTVTTAVLRNLSLVIWFLSAGFPLPFIKRLLRCSCGHCWPDPERRPVPFFSVALLMVLIGVSAFFAAQGACEWARLYGSNAVVCGQ